MKKKGIVISFFVFFLVALIAVTSCYLAQKSRADDVKQDCVQEIFTGAKALAERLEFISHSGEYSTKESEKIQWYLSSLDRSVVTCEKLSANSDTESVAGFSTLAKALGSNYLAEHNGVMVQSVLYDGKVSADELEFISALCADVNILLEQMTSDDGLNMRSDISYDNVRYVLYEFLEKWGEWSWSSEAPYDLLNA